MLTIEKKRAKTLKEVADHMGVSYDTVRKEWRQAGMPGEHGNWPLDKIVAWARSRIRDPVAIDRADQLTGNEPTTSTETSVPDASTPDEVDQFDPKNPEDVAAALARRRLAEARIKEADAAKRERENRLAEANIVHRADVELFCSSFFSHIRDQIEVIPDQLGPTLPKAHRRQIMEEVRARLELFLRNAHGWLEQVDEIGVEDE